MFYPDEEVCLSLGRSLILQLPVVSKFALRQRLANTICATFHTDENIDEEMALISDRRCNPVPCGLSQAGISLPVGNRYASLPDSPTGRHCPQLFPRSVSAPVLMEIGGKSILVDKVIEGPLCNDTWSGTVYVTCNVQVYPWEEQPTFLKNCDLIHRSRVRSSTWLIITIQPTTTAVRVTPARSPGHNHDLEKEKNYEKQEHIGRYPGHHRQP